MPKTPTHLDLPKLKALSARLHASIALNAPFKGGAGANADAREHLRQKLMAEANGLSEQRSGQLDASLGCDHDREDPEPWEEL